MQLDKYPVKARHELLKIIVPGGQTAAITIRESNMTAQSIESPRKPTTRHRAKRKTYKDSDTKARRIVALAVHSNAPPMEIAELCNTSHQNVYQTLNRYGIDIKDLDNYKKQRSDILAGIQDKILNKIELSGIKIDSAKTLKDALTGFGILYDKERLETGKTTGNIGVGIALSEPMQAAVDRIISRAQPVTENKV
jgi:predicted DNA-binding protein YlxM (UPF0122 family)